MTDLCRFLSKTSIDTNDKSEPSYFDAQTNSCPKLPDVQAAGVLSKTTNDISDIWTVDLKVPPVKGYVAQDWPKNCPTVKKNDQDYGCDLWITVTDIKKTPPVCGNGIKEEGEYCDDGNTISGDGCSSKCKLEPPVCGNGKIEWGETCDDGNTKSWDGCSSFCRIEPVCGNHKVEQGEACDDGNKISGDGCSSTCQKEFRCWDGRFKLNCNR
jgi:cysteine-rich repeat protein